MREVDNAFKSGDYHRQHEKHGGVFRRKARRMLYDASFSIVEKLGLLHPLKIEQPRILQSGTGSSETTSVFVQFVYMHNRNTRLAILDISSYTLEWSKLRLEKEQKPIDKITYHLEDARNTSFTDNYFDGIETDFFIQFFSEEDKYILFKEWFRILKPGGMVTTRDWIIFKEKPLERLLDIARTQINRINKRPASYRADTLQIQRLLEIAGFSVAIVPAIFPFIHMQLPLIKHVIAYKPLTTT